MRVSDRSTRSRSSCRDTARPYQRPPLRRPDGSCEGAHDRLTDRTTGRTTDRLGRRPGWPAEGGSDGGVARGRGRTGRAPERVPRRVRRHRRPRRARVRRARVDRRGRGVRAARALVGRRARPVPHTRARAPTDRRCTRATGTVVVEWLNVSGGHDIAVTWSSLRDMLFRDGTTWVGVTAQPLGVHHLTPGTRSATDSAPSRASRWRPAPVPERRVVLGARLHRGRCTAAQRRGTRPLFGGASADARLRVGAVTVGQPADALRGACPPRRPRLRRVRDPRRRPRVARRPARPRRDAGVGRRRSTPPW